MPIAIIAVADAWVVQSVASLTVCVPVCVSVLWM